LYMQYLVSSVQEDSEESPVKIQDAGSRIEEILASDELVIDCWDSLAYWPEIMDVLVLEDDAKKRLSKKWQDRLMALRNSSRLSTEEQLAGWLPLLHYHFEATEEPLPASVAKQLDQDIAQADQKVSNAYARQSLVNQIRWIYQTAHMNDKARAVLLAELDRSKAPYYFMSSLGSLAEDQEQTEEAIEWYRKAYETSEGSATRFQWGASYVRALIRLAPDQDELILSTAESLFDELPSSDDVFSGRNFRVLKRLNEQLVVWKADEDSEAVNTRFTARIESLCAAEVDGSIEKANCQSLIAEDSAS